MPCIKLKSVLLLFIYCSLSSGKYSLNTTSKSKVQIVETIQGYYLKNIASRFGYDFNTTSNEEMGVLFIQKMYEKFKYTSILPDVEKRLNKIAQHFESMLNESFYILTETRQIIERYYYVKNASALNSVVLPCNEDYYFEEFDITNSEVNPNNSYFEEPANLRQVLKGQKLRSGKLKGVIKQQYFLSTHDVMTSDNIVISNCKEQNHSLLWSTYSSRMEKKPKNVMLLLDHGGSLSKQQFKIVKAIASQMISVLSERDRIGILAVSDDVSVPYITEQCSLPNQMTPLSETYSMKNATKHYKDLFGRFINSLVKGTGATNHSLGFQQAFQIIRVSDIPSNEKIMLLYVSRGLLSSLMEPKTVLETILNSMEELENNSLIINTCAVIDESKPVMYETHFLKDIAEQNYSKYSILSEKEDFARGILLTVNSTQGVGLAVTRLYNTLSETRGITDLSEKISLPVWDPFSKTFVISISIPCGINGEIGVLGIDLFFANLIEDITYYSNYLQYTYSFLINNNGTAIMHPSYPRPMAVSKQLNYVDISNLEKIKGFDIVRKLMLNEKSGQYKVRNGNNTYAYYWKRVVNLYTIGILVKEHIVPPKHPYKVTWFPSSIASKLMHHRLDIRPATNMCKHLNQLATLDAGSLYLSASCFQSPTTYFHLSTSSNYSPLAVQKCMAFLKDNTRYLSNPGLREEIRDDVASLAHILEYLRSQHLHGKKGKYIVRRYVTSPSGVLQMFPGGVISPGFEPTKRTWFLTSIEHRYKTVLTPPYLDAGGAGYIVTIAYATDHAVIAMDVTFGYIYKLLLRNMPFCKQKNLKCFMMDDRGYLIYHPNLIDPNGHGPIEQQHIIHKESLVANDILNHNNFVRKKLCNNFGDGTIQRYYTLNTSIEYTLINAVHGEHSVKYQVNAVPGTNIFIGVVNATLEVVATFCPCSMINRLCLNCNRMEQRECECPCECPLNLNTCTYANKTLIDNPVCPTVPEQSFSLPINPYENFDNDLKPCLPISCEELLTYDSCLGILGCEWCHLDVDGESVLSSPFCTSIQTCFNGILGSPTPYGEFSDRPLNSHDLLGSGYMPIGPVIGIVLGVCLVLVFSFICYRSYTSSPVERFYLTSSQDNQVRMSDLNINDDYLELDNHQDKLLKDNKPISPYCVSTGYRRPLTAADSDHGYSTMTPHDDSEHLSFAPVEIDSLEEDCTSDAASINTSISSRRHMRLLDRNKLKPLHPSDLQVTNLNTRNCIIAPVTVHRNMEFVQ